MSEVREAIAVVGGTGAEGGGLSLRLAKAGYKVIIGSRDMERARAAAAKMNARLGGGNVTGDESTAAAGAADIVIITVPYSGQSSTALALEPSLQGKILIDATVPLIPPKVSQVQLPGGGSAVAKLQEKLGADVRVVSAFQNVSAHHLNDLNHEVDCDVLVCGNDLDACNTVISLCEKIGLRGIHAGPIANSAAVEALTSVLISINRRYKVAGSGIRITGL